MAALVVTTIATRASDMKPNTARCGNVRSHVAYTGQRLMEKRVRSKRIREINIPANGTTPEENNLENISLHLEV